MKTSKKHIKIIKKELGKRRYKTWYSTNIFKWSMLYLSGRCYSRESIQLC